MAREFLIVIGLVFCTAGCESRTLYQFQFVDADSGKPLVGVRGNSFVQGSHFGNRLFPVTELYDLPPSDQAGVIPLRLITNGHFGYSLSFAVKGYKVLGAWPYFSGHDPNLWYVEYVDVTDSFESEVHWYWDQFPKTRVRVLPSEATRIPMYRLPSPTTAPAK